LKSIKKNIKKKRKYKEKEMEDKMEQEENEFDVKEMLENFEIYQHSFATSNELYLPQDEEEDEIKSFIQQNEYPEEISSNETCFQETVVEEEEIQEENEMLSIQKIGLEEKGYVFLKGVFSKDVIDRTVFEVQHFMNEEGIASHLQKRQDVPQQRYYVNNTYGALQNYQQIQYYYVPVIDNRGTYNRITDMGVVDIYNVDKLFPQIKNYFSVSLMQMILLKSTGIEWKLTRVNIQFYNSVSHPNAFHVDNGNEKNIKFTIYLTDILDDLAGPISFMEGTHLQKKNIRPSQTKTFLGERGDVLISYQNGYHKRLPQRVACTNMYLTFHFTTKNDKERYFPMQL
jgi:hypothetical protein